jgi:hypothetical protein
MKIHRNVAVTPDTSSQEKWVKLILICKKCN